MLKINLDELKIEHPYKRNDKCPYTEPNINDTCLLEAEGEVIGFYIKDLDDVSPKMAQLLGIANAEFRTDRVPKQYIDRMATLQIEGSRAEARDKGMTQWSTMLGSIPPQPVMKRNYRNQAQIHRVEKAQLFVKAMMGIALESENIFKKLAPHLYEQQMECVKDVAKEWRFGNMFTSGICNFNIAVDYHQDIRNIVGSLNVILTRRNNANGGCLNVPDYNATFEQGNNSMLVYPAWRNMHGVTPIEQFDDEGYRNSFILYSLKAFIDGDGQK